MSSFTLYVIGFLVLIGGLCAGAALMGVPAQWIAVGAVVLAGLGLITGVANTRKKDESEAS